MSPRGDTGRHRRANLPPGFFEGPQENLDAGGLVVHFRGEDDREAVFDLSVLPLPGWHSAMAQAWARRIGPAGELRTHSSVMGAWNRLKHFMNYLARGLGPPESPGDLRVRHGKGYMDKLANVSEATASKYIHSVAQLFDNPPLANMISDEVKACFRPRSFKNDEPLSGYSDREYNAILEAARKDVFALRERLAAPKTMRDAVLLLELRATGRVPSEGVQLPELGGHHRRIAEQLFVTKRDVIPLLVLLVALSGWNVETMKELSSEHRILEDRAVEIWLIKRRRGEGQTERLGTWEIGRHGRDLDHAGGLYLLLLDLMAPARKLLPNEPFWAVWAGGGKGTLNGVRDAFAHSLNLEERNSDWIAKHRLFADSTVDSPDGDEDSTEGAVRQPLSLNFNRLKTSAEVRRVRSMGGHLPSAARSNTVPVLFRNYLAGDATTLDWAREEMADSLVDVEEAAFRVHREALAATGRTQLEIRPIRDASNATTIEETAWTACSDHAHHPLTGRRCKQSFMDCFHCANSVITREHLPGIVALLDALEGRRQFVDGETWWRRYGPTWTAIRYDVLPKFTETEVQLAIEAGEVDALLDLVEAPWEIS